MKHPIYPCIWLNNEAGEAARLYCSAFPGAAILNETPMVVMVDIGGQSLMCLNGGPQFRPTPAISLYVVCETEAELDSAWQQLSEGGKVMMPLDKYDWSPKYGWVQDRFGVSWQLTLGKVADMGQKVTPAFMFVGEQFGRAEEALQLYGAIFPDAAVHGIYRYPDASGLPQGKVMHSQFDLLGRRFIAMDGAGSHDFSFTEGMSLVVTCDTQAEIDHFWDRLSEGGEESQCGWLKDRFGVSWQVVPAVLPQLMNDPERGPRVVEAFLKMKKFEIKELVNA